MYTLTEEEIDQIIEEQEDKAYDEYVELLQDLEWSRSTVDVDAEISDYYEQYPDEDLLAQLCAQNTNVDCEGYGIEGPMY